MTRHTATSTGPFVGVAGLLGVAFVVLKLTAVIDWPWVWVLAPFWVPLALGVVGLLIALGIIVLVGSLGGSKR